MTCKRVTNQNCSNTNTEPVLRGTMFQQELIFCMLLAYQIISHGSCIEGIEPFSDTEVAPRNNGKCGNCLEAPRKAQYAEYKARKLVPISLENTAYIRSHPVLVAKRSFACLRQCLRVGNLQPSYRALQALIEDPLAQTNVVKTTNYKKNKKSLPKCIFHLVACPTGL